MPLNETAPHEAIAPDTSRKVKLPKAHVSDAGRIQNLLELSHSGTSIILSTANAVRANHWHREDWHYLYVLHGSFVYFWRPVGSKDTPARMTVVGGEMLYTPPREEHAMWFRENTVTVSMSRLPRDHESHENDVVRLEEPLCVPR